MIASSEVLAEKFRDIFDRNIIIDRIYSSICILNTLLNSDGFMKLSEEKKNKLYSEIRNTVDYIQNIIMIRRWSEPISILGGYRATIFNTAYQCS